jgi:tRNA-uridine 2-sulfurtransferase
MIAVAMSGGVDSSTAAALLKNQGHDLVGFSMQLWNQRRINVGPDGEPLPSRCCSLDDLYDARVVASKLGFPSTSSTSKTNSSATSCARS